MRKLFIPVFSLIAAGCATTYQSGASSFTGGFYETPGPGRLEKVAFSGNGFISAKTVEQYALYRCAEKAKSMDKKYFVLYDSLIQAGRRSAAKGPTVGSVDGKPTAFAFVLYLDVPQAGAFDTDKVLKELDAVVKAGKANT